MWFAFVPESPQRPSHVVVPRHTNLLCGIFLPHILFVRHFSSETFTLPDSGITNYQVDNIAFLQREAEAQKLPHDNNLR